MLYIASRKGAILHAECLGHVPLSRPVLCLTLPPFPAPVFSFVFCFLFFCFSCACQRWGNIADGAADGPAPGGQQPADPACEAALHRRLSQDDGRGDVSLFQRDDQPRPLGAGGGRAGCVCLCLAGEGVKPVGGGGGERDGERGAGAGWLFVRVG